MRDSIRALIQAFFLSEGAYAETSEGPRPALRGLAIVILVGVAVALVGLVGTTLEWATTPNMADVKDVVLEGLQDMPWYQQLDSNPKFRRQFQEWYDRGWQIFPQLFDWPNVGTAAARLVILPLGLTLVWFLYGLLAYAAARMLGGQGDLGQTLGCTALAVAPQLLNIFSFFPYLVVGGVVGTWTLLCRYVALKACHRLTWGRALAATLLPYVAFALVLGAFGCLGSVVLGLIIGGGSR
jgi:hypothetical protein